MKNSMDLRNGRRPVAVAVDVQAAFLSQLVLFWMGLFRKALFWKKH